MSEGSGPESDTPGDLGELRRVVARVQHEINNPLAALLAEVQLLILEPAVPDEHRASAKRMEDLVRRVIAAVRKLDEVKGEPSL